MDGWMDEGTAVQLASQAALHDDYPISSCSWYRGNRFHAEVEEGLRINVMTDYIHFHDDIMETDWN